MRWPGFRKVRKQVCKRIDRRLTELDLADVTAYRHYLTTHPDEWAVLDDFCRITISRFYRDIGLFDFFGRETLPHLLRVARERGQSQIRCWSAGCASGEEPYTVVLLWKLLLQPMYPSFSLSIIATDADPHMLARARDGIYSHGSLKDIPADWQERAFERQAGLFRLREEFREPVTFQQQDLRGEMPSGKFDLIFCRNLAFTYFNEELQKEILLRLIEKLHPGGRLVLGQHETLPVLPPELAEDQPALGIYARRMAST